MFESVNTPVTENENLTVQADETSGRPSQQAESAAEDRLINKPVQDSYADLHLPKGISGANAILRSFKTLAAELGLSCQAAQKLVDWEFAYSTQNTQALADAQRNEILQHWKDQTREMLGAQYKERTSQALEAVQRFGGEELRALLDATGLGNHPAVVRTFYEISRQTGEDQSVGGRVSAGTDKTFTEALYGKGH